VTKRILVVDDDRAFCRALGAALRRRGHETLIAHDVKEGKEEATAWQPSHAVLDLRMPEQSGLELLEHLCRQHPKVRVVVLTGYGSIPTAVEAVKLGAIQYLTKPVSTDTLLNALDGRAPDVFVESTTPLEEVERLHLLRVLEECSGNISEAARRLGMHRRTLQRKLAKKRDPRPGKD
jgi:two-component system response regulator RegA